MAGPKACARVDLCAIILFLSIFLQERPATYEFLSETLQPSLPETLCSQRFEAKKEHMAIFCPRPHKQRRGGISFGQNHMF